MSNYIAFASVLSYVTAMANRSYKIILKEELARRCERNPRYSLRAFARSLGFEATNVSQMMSGKRVPTLKTAQRLMVNLDLSTAEQRAFLESLAKVQKSRSAQKINDFLNTNPHLAAEEIKLELFRVIADSYHYAILALSQTQGFKSNSKWIASQLSISEIEAKLAIERMLELGLLVKKNGKLESSRNGFTTADKSVTDAALRRHQRQILEKALFSLENHPIEHRNMSSMTMAINPERLNEAKKKIESFTQELSEFLEEGVQKKVYQLGIALFPLQIQKGNNKCN